MSEQYEASSFIEFLYSETDTGFLCSKDEESTFKLSYKEQCEEDNGSLTITDWELLLNGEKTDPLQLCERFGVEFITKAVTALFIEKNLTHLNRRDPDGI